MKRLLFMLAVSIVVCMSVPALWAANTGKISGRVVDAASKEPIPSVNVAVVGTSTGASTNADGEYYILNLPVGTYDLKVTSLGYETQNITGVDVLADQTRELNVSLTETVIQGQEVTVVAQRDVIRRDVSTTVRSVTSQEITALPITTFRDALSRTAGVVGTGNNIHIRGGRPDEIMFLVDGLQVKDPQFSTRSMDVSPEAIGEMQVLTAGFNAEYGEAQSAVVNLVIKEGDPQYHGRLQQVNDFRGLSGSHEYPTVSSGNVSPQLLGPKSVSNYQAYTYSQATLSGPEPITQWLLPKLGARVPGTMSFFGSATGWGRNTNENGVWTDTDDWYRHPLFQIAGGKDVRRNEAYFNSNLKLTYAPAAKYKFSLGWNQAQQWVNPYLFRMSKRFPLDYPDSLVTAGMHALASAPGWATNALQYSQLPGKDNDGDGRINEEVMNGVDDDGDGLIDEDLQPYSFNANNAVRTDRVRDQQFSFSFNHNVSQKTYYTLRASMFDAQRFRAGENKAPALYGAASEAFTDLPDASGRYNGRYDVGEPFVDTNGNGMWDYNNPTNAYPSVASGFHIAGTGLTGNTQQLVPDWANFASNTYTFKGDITSQVTPRHMVKSGIEYNYYNTASEDRPYTTVANNGQGIYTDVYRYYPSAAAGYIQDKMEYRDIIVNAGLRLDYWRIGGSALQSVIAREPNRQSYVDYEPPKKGGEAYLSPRLGIAYSVTENDVFHFNYGYFYQRGRQDYYFTGVNQLQTGGTPIIGNPGLKPMKTIAYELGVRHQFSNDFLFEVSTYYKDIKNWINTASENQLFYELYNRLIVGTNAAIYYNADYASVRGFEFNLSKQYGSHLSGRVTYTMAWATGKNSYDIGSNVTRDNYVVPARETPLAWDRRHQIVFNLGWNNVPVKGKPFSVQWLKTGWEVNVLSQALSGLPYTPTSANGTDLQGQEFAKRSPWTYTTDLNVSRGFKMASLNWRALLEIRNLFNRLNVLGWDANQNTLDSYMGGLPGYVNDSSSPNFGSDPKSGPNPDAWSAPRQVRVGLALEF